MSRLLTPLAAVTPMLAVTIPVQAQHALDHAPASAEYVMYIENQTQSFQSLMNYINQAMGDELLGEFGDMGDLNLGAMFFGMPLDGVDEEGELVMAVSGLAGVMNGDPSGMSMVMIVTLEDEDAFQLAAKDMQITATVRDGFGIVSLMENEDEQPPVEGGMADHLEAVLGPEAVDALSQSDMSMYINVPATFEPMLPTILPLLESMRDDMELGLMEDELGVDEAVLTGVLLDAMEDMLLDFASGSEAVLISADIADDLLVVHEFIEVTAGSDWEGYWPPDAGQASALLDELPNQPFIYAFATDTRAPSLSTVLDPIMDNLPEDDFGIVAAMQTAYQGFGPTHGVAHAYYTPTPSHLIAGQLLRSVTVFDVADADQAAGSIQAVVEQADGTTFPMHLILEAMGIPTTGEMLLPVTTAYQADHEQVAGISVDHFLRTMELPEDFKEQLGSARNLARNFTHLQGYVAATDERVIMTTVADSALMAQTLELGEGGISNSTVIADYRETYMPPHLGLEGYLDIQQAFTAFGPFSTLLGGPEIPIYDGLRPIALGVGYSEGLVHATVVLPAESLRAIVETALLFDESAEIAPPQSEPAPF